MKTLSKFASPLAEEWQTSLIEALDVLNRLEKDGYVFTRHIGRPMAKMIANGAVNNMEIEIAIKDIDEIIEEGQGIFVKKKLYNVRNVLVEAKEEGGQ